MFFHVEFFYFLEMVGDRREIEKIGDDGRTVAHSEAINKIFFVFEVPVLLANFLLPDYQNIIFDQNIFLFICFFNRLFYFPLTAFVDTRVRIYLKGRYILGNFLLLHFFFRFPGIHFISLDFQEFDQLQNCCLCWWGFLFSSLILLPNWRKHLDFFDIFLLNRN